MCGHACQASDLLREIHSVAMVMALALPVVIVSVFGRRDIVGLTALCGCVEGKARGPPSSEPIVSKGVL